MSIIDPIADYLTRIRNAILRRHKEVAIPYSNIKKGITEILLSEGFISSYKVSQMEGTKFDEIKITLKYDYDHSPVIRSLKRISKPGIRQYKGYREIYPVKSGQGVSIVSTSQGLKTDGVCRREKIGGEILCEIF